MVKQKKHTCITQSGKNYAINCAIQGVRLIWRQKNWLAICKFLWSLTNQNALFVSSFCTELTLFCTVLEKNCTALNQSKWRIFFMYIIRSETAHKQRQQTWPWQLKSLFEIIDLAFRMLPLTSSQVNCFILRATRVTGITELKCII